jgi:KipI family sensor histidine kinase inhibitor
MPAYRWASDHGLLVSFPGGPDETVRADVLGAFDALRRLPAVRNLHPAAASLLVVCDPAATDPAAFEADVRAAVDSRTPRPEGERRLLQIPVCYEGDYAPDLAEVARLHGSTAEAVVARHSGADYVVSFLGFAPGFPYLDGLPEDLATPRLARPRKLVPAGSVAIGGPHAGIYPFATPGGWRIVGRTPLAMFRVDRDPPSLLEPGDAVRFVPVSPAAFRDLAAKAS